MPIGPYLYSFWNLGIGLYLTTLISCSTLTSISYRHIFITIAKKNPKPQLHKDMSSKQCNVILLWNCELPWANNSRADTDRHCFPSEHLLIPPCPCGFAVGLQGAVMCTSEPWTLRWEFCFKFGTHVTVLSGFPTWSPGERWCWYWTQMKVTKRKQPQQIR